MDETWAATEYIEKVNRKRVDKLTDALVEIRDNPFDNPNEDDQFKVLVDPQIVELRGSMTEGFLNDYKKRTTIITYDIIKIQHIMIQANAY